MKIYKVLHIPSGMYFRPSEYPNHSNLSKTGKVYHRLPNIEKWLGFSGGLFYNHPKKDYPYYDRKETKLEDWQIIEGEI